MSSAPEGPVADSGVRTQDDAGGRTVWMTFENGVHERVVVHEDRAPRGAGKRATRFSDPYAVLFLPELMRIAADRELTGTHLRVLLAVLTRAHYVGTVFDSDPTGIARELGLDTRQVTRALAILASKGLLLRPRRGKIALHPMVAWRGSAEEREKAKRALKERELDA